MANLQHLDSRFAVDDVAALIRHLQVEYGPELPVIVHGFDHGGAIAVWLKHRHPELVTGVWAASATVLARKDYGEFMVNVGKVIRKIGGDECYDRTETVFKRMDQYYSTGQYAILDEKFNLCVPLNPSNPIEGGVLFATYALVLGSALRYSHAVGIAQYCQMLMDSEDELTGFAQYVNTALVACLDVNAVANFEQFRNVDWDAITNEVGQRQLTYQLCRELGWFRSSTYDNQPFGNRFPIDLFHQQCQFIFGPVYVELTD